MKELKLDQIDYYKSISHRGKYKNYSIVQSQWTLARPENHKGDYYKSQEDKDPKGKGISSLGNKGQTKDFKRRRYLSRLHSNNSSLKMAHV